MGKSRVGGVNPAYLTRAFNMDLPTVYAQVGDVIVYNGFGRYIHRLEKHVVMCKYDMNSVLKASLKEHPAKTCDGREWR